MHSSRKAIPYRKSHAPQIRLTNSEEEEKNTKEQNKVEEEIEDWRVTNKKKELKEQELKNNNIKTLQTSQEYTFPSDTETLTPQSTAIDRYGHPISVTVQEKNQMKEDTSEDTSDDNSVVTIDGID